MQTYVVDGAVVQVLGGDGGLDDLLQNLLAKLLGGNVLRVLGRNDDGVDTEGHDSAVVVLVLDGDLGLGVGAEPRQRAVAASSRHGSVELVGEEESQGEQLGGLVGGIAEHDALVTGAKVLEAVVEVETLRDIRGLLLDGDEQVEGLVVEALGGVIVADVLDGLADDLLVVDLGLGGDLTKDHDHAGLGGRLAGDLGEGILRQAGIEDGVGDLIGDLVGVALTDGLGLARGGQRQHRAWAIPHPDSGGRTYGEEEGSLVVVLPVRTRPVGPVGTVGSHYDLCGNWKLWRGLR